MPRKVPAHARKSPPRKPPTHWDREAQRVIRLEMLRADIGPEELAKRMKAEGFAIPSEKALALRIARGTFSFGFALCAFRALGVETLDLSHVRDKPAKRPRAT
jgi:hypothetical protein